jgi:hypothetical protein
MERMIQAKAVVKKRGMMRIRFILRRNTDRATRKNGMIKALIPKSLPMNRSAQTVPRIPPLLAASASDANSSSLLRRL